MSDDLVERVARTACASVNSADTWDETGTDVHEMVWFPIARAAIAVALEEAAKVAENASFHFTQTTPSTVEVVDVRHTIAAAIRALAKQSTTEEERA